MRSCAATVCITRCRLALVGKDCRKESRAARSSAVIIAAATSDLVAGTGTGEGGLGAAAATSDLVAGTGEGGLGAAAPTSDLVASTGEGGLGAKGVGKRSGMLGETVESVLTPAAGTSTGVLAVAG